MKIKPLPGSTRQTCVHVDNGQLTLAGELDWAYQRTSAERCVRALAGVLAVHNLITMGAQRKASGYEQRL